MLNAEPTSTERTAILHDYDDAYTQLPIGVFVCDSTYKVRWVNEQFRSVFECVDKQIVGHGLFSLLSPRDRAGADRMCRALNGYTGGFVDVQVGLEIAQRSFFTHVRLIQRDGVWLGYAENTLQDQGPTYDLLLSQQRWKGFIRHAQDGIALLDGQGRMIEHNQRFFRLMQCRTSHGISMSEAAMRGKSLSELTNEVALAPLSEAIARWEDGGQGQFEAVIKRGKRWLELRASPTVVPLFGFAGSCVTLRDVTAERLLAAQRAKTMKTLTAIQKLMSPASEPVTVGDFRLASLCEMAESCGGDWWTYRQLERGKLLLVIGDVTGHGIPSAIIAATARGAVEGVVSIDGVEPSPARVLEAIHSAITDVGGGKLLMTACALLFDPQTSELTLANAGHCFPLVMPAGPNERIRALASRGSPLGSGDLLLGEKTFSFKRGEVFIMFTDGIVERIDAQHDQFGARRLYRCLRQVSVDMAGGTAQRALSRIVDAVRTFAGDAAPDDDMTLVLCQYLS